MLVLTRKVDEKIKIGDNIVVSILSVEGGGVKIGIDAPREVTILRMEVLEQRVSILQRLRIFLKRNCPRSKID